MPEDLNTVLTNQLSELALLSFWVSELQPLSSGLFRTERIFFFGCWMFATRGEKLEAPIPLGPLEKANRIQ